MNRIDHFYSVFFLACCFASILAGNSPVSLQIPRPVVHPSLESYGLRASGQIHAWIYFKDKGLNSEEEVAALLKAEERLSERNSRRRSKSTNGKIVSTKDIPVFESYISRVVNTGATLRNRSKWINAISIAATVEQIENISQFPFVSKIDPVLVHKRPKKTVEENYDSFQDTFLKRFDGDDGDSSFYGISKDQIEQINCHLAHDAGYTGEGVIVLMIDTGFFKDHQSIQKGRIIAEWDFINDDGNTQNEEGDGPFQHSHGTSTLSTLGGYARWSFMGPAYEAKFVLAKTEILDQEIQQEEDNYVAALEWGEDLGADVASSSLGYLDWYSYCDMDGNTAVTTRAVDIAVSLGMVCVSSAGNEGRQQPPEDPCDTLTHYIIAPSDADSVIAVGAVDEFGNIARFSSRGPTYDGRIKPEVCARGVATASATSSAVDSYAFLNGTSLSCPLVAGAAAVVLSAHPDWSPMEVREAFMKTASLAENANNSYGYGIIDVWAAINYLPLSEKLEVPVPSKFFLAQNYPNPFNNSAVFDYELPVDSEITLTVFNLLGEEIETLVRKKMVVGRHSIQWNGSSLTSGIYFIVMRTDDIVITRKAILVK